MSRWRRFRALERNDLRTFVVACTRLTVVHAMLAILGTTRTQRILGVVPTMAATGTIDRVRAERAATAMQRAARHLPLRTNCLDHALALWWMLDARGLASTLQIGVRKDEDANLVAHAWIEYGGAVLLDETAAHYAPLEARR